MQRTRRQGGVCWIQLVAVVAVVAVVVVLGYWDSFNNLVHR